VWTRITSQSPPRLELDALERVGVGVAEEDGWPARLGACEGDGRAVERGGQLVDVGDADAEVAVAPAVLC
jgi:hypothetical protein